MNSKPLSAVLRDLHRLKPPIKISSDTIRNYWKWNLAPLPVKKGGGRGAQAEYPEDMACHVAASCRLLKTFKISAKRIAKAREIALHIYGMFETSDMPHFADRKLREYISEDVQAATLARQWLFDFTEAQEQLYRTWSKRTTHVRMSIFITDDDGKVIRPEEKLPRVPIRAWLIFTIDMAMLTLSYTIEKVEGNKKKGYDINH